MSANEQEDQMTPTPPQEQTEQEAFAALRANIVAYGMACSVLGVAEVQGNADAKAQARHGAWEEYGAVDKAIAALRASSASMQAQAPEVAALQREVEELRARYQWLRDRFLGADFDWGHTDEDGDHGTPVLLIKFDGVTVYGDLDCTIAAAMASKAEVPNGQ